MARKEAEPQIQADICPICFTDWIGTPTVDRYGLRKCRICMTVWNRFGTITHTEEGAKQARVVQQTEWLKPENEEVIVTEHSLTAALWGVDLDPPDAAIIAAKVMANLTGKPKSDTEYTYHAPLNESTALEFVIGVNDERIVQPDQDDLMGVTDNSLYQHLIELAADPDTWKLDVEVRDDDGCTMVVVPIMEREA